MSLNEQQQQQQQQQHRLTGISGPKQQLSMNAASFSIAAILGKRSESDIETPASPPSPERIEPEAVSRPSSVSSVDSIDVDVSVTDEIVKQPHSPELKRRSSKTASVAKSSNGISSGTGHPDFGAIKCKLDTKDLWDKFHDLGTEMIITKTGRRMFPTVRASFTGLEAETKYHVYMDIVCVDQKRYRYAYHRSSWLVAGKADPPLPTRLYLHPDSPFSSEQLQKQSVSFEKVKLTNNPTDNTGQIILNSMHKYQPRVHIARVREDMSGPLDTADQLNGEVYRTFLFPETTFIAVTAYQNQLITRLKIDSNPFAKGFRDSSRLSDMDRENVETLMRMQTFTGPVTMGVPGGFDIARFQMEALRSSRPDLSPLSDQFRAEALSLASSKGLPLATAESLLARRNMYYNPMAAYSALTGLPFSPYYIPQTYMTPLRSPVTCTESENRIILNSPSPDMHLTQNGSELSPRRYQPYIVPQKRTIDSVRTS